jgi:hypothetical protein
MKNDSTTTAMNFVLAALVILGVVFALLNIWRSRDLRHLQTALQVQMQKYQYGTAKAQALLNDAIAYNATAKNAEMAQIIQSVQPPQTAAK